MKLDQTLLVTGLVIFCIGIRVHQKVRKSIALIGLPLRKNKLRRETMLQQEIARELLGDSEEAMIQYSLEYGGRFRSCLARHRLSHLLLLLPGPDDVTWLASIIAQELKENDANSYRSTN